MSGIKRPLGECHPLMVPIRARWTEILVGGHFAALEQPPALASDIHEAFSVFR
jgi:hypothetical protein